MSPVFSPLRLAIIADDLTGALDASAGFAGRGLRVEVALRPEAVADAVVSGAEVVTVSTCSREITPEAAKAAVAAAVAQLPAGVRLFKKVDSRLKGHIPAELSALSFTRALVAPAIPDFGRIVRGGAVTGFGVETPIPVAGQLGEFADRCTIPEVASDAEMAAALAAFGEDGLLIGARGLAEVLARQMTGRDVATAPALAGPRGLMLIGSRDPITLAQVAHLRQSRPGLQFVPAPDGVIEGAPGTGDLALVQALPGAGKSTGAEVGERLASGLHPAFTSRYDTVLMTGGATAEAVLMAMGIHRLRLLGDCLPGLPVAVARQADGKTLTIVAKSGGFGGVETLTQVADMIGAAG
ncbi:four-carbon acid sugar kinase family protein [Radicibacter daui]|uniref:four-carbon acid sugar kinase family protein n=1 Tax=Radicibacter daui TaxID=3064829 RepID=UPI004046D330